MTISHRFWFTSLLAAMAAALVFLAGQYYGAKAPAIGDPNRGGMGSVALIRTRVPIQASVTANQLPGLPPVGLLSNPAAGSESKTNDVRLLASSTKLRPTIPPPNPKTEGIFSDFQRWQERYQHAISPAEKQPLEATGVALARERREAMLALIQNQPQRAIELSTPRWTQKSLPAAVQTWLEQPMNTRGDLAVLGVLAEPGKTVKPVIRTVEIGDQSYHAYVYGRRLLDTTLTNIPLQGIVLGQHFAVAENPMQLLAQEEIQDIPVSAFGAACPICAGAGSETQGNLWGAVGGERIGFCGEEHAAAYNDQLIADDGLHSPMGQVAPASPASTSWTTGEKTLLLIRVDFPDMVGDPFADATGTDLIRNLNTFYRESSYNKAGFALEGNGSDVTPTFRMPNRTSYYGTNDYFARLRSDARAAASAAGYNLSHYKFDMICFGSIAGFDWSGLGYIGDAGLWLRNSFSTGVAAHELGHNFGLLHANYWDTSGESVVGPGTSVEYGDKFDTMGSASAGQKHFNAKYKNVLNWLVAADIKTFTTNGIYQLYPQDVTNVTTGIRGLKIAKNPTTNYWVEFRKIYTSNKWLVNGVSLRWAPASGNQPTMLLDTTPGSLDGKDDAAIVFGRTYADEQAQLYITPLGRTNTQPESVLIAINKGAFPSNHPPILDLSAGVTNIATGGSISFTTQAEDPDGDELAYAWDFGDRNFGPNAPVATNRWTASGLYLVRCVVSDMKGGTASKSVVVRVGSTTSKMVSGKITRYGQPLANARVSASSAYSALTDSDGTYKLAGLPNGSYTLSAKYSGLAFIHPGFLNPVSVNSSQTSLDFLAIPSTGQKSVTIVPEGAIWRYLDNGSNQGTNWIKEDFDDGAWKRGAAKLGYGDSDVTTTVSYGGNSSAKYITTYFRNLFVVNDPTNLSTLTLSVQRDDGAVVYLNGREVFRSNMPSGAIGYRTTASSTVNGADELLYFETQFSSSYLKTGTNCLAVEVHQVNQTSSDLGFDLRLAGVKTSAYAQPKLAWQPGGGNLTLSWPLTTDGWTLFSNASTNLAAEANWQPLAGDYRTTTNGLVEIDVPASKSSQFFILKK